MSTLTGTLGHALLGVLAEGPRTGYGLVRHLAQSIAYTWPASHSQVYPELAKLREAGLIREGAAAPRGGRVYELTDAGLDEVRRWLRETEPSRTVRDEASLRLFFLWLLEPDEAEAYLRGEAERARATLAEFEEIAAQEDPDTPKTRAYRIALELGLRTTQGAARVGRGPRSQHPPALGLTTITSSTRTPKRPSRRIDGSSVKVIPASSGVSSSTERNGRSCTSSPIPWPIRWRKPSPSPAASIGARQAALTSRASAPGLAAARPASCASSSTRRHLLVVGRRLAAGNGAAEVGAVAHARRRRSRRARPRPRAAPRGFRGRPSRAAARPR